MGGGGRGWVWAQGARLLHARPHTRTYTPVRHPASACRSLTSVVPVENPLASSEPELLEMSPEQAEQTQLKLAVLRGAVEAATPHRRAAARGAGVCCCTVTLDAWVVPPYCRAWEV